MGYRFIQSVGACRLRSLKRAIALDYKEKKERDERETEFGWKQRERPVDRKESVKEESPKLFFTFRSLSSSRAFPSSPDQNFSTETSFRLDEGERAVLAYAVMRNFLGARSSGMANTPLESPAPPRRPMCTRQCKTGGGQGRKFRAPKGRKKRPASVSTAALTESSDSKRCSCSSRLVKRPTQKSSDLCKSCSQTNRQF